MPPKDLLHPFMVLQRHCSIYPFEYVDRFFTELEQSRQRLRVLTNVEWYDEDWDCRYTIRWYLLERLQQPQSMCIHPLLEST